VLGSIVYNFFNYEFGFLNSFLASLGIERTNVYDDPSAWGFILVFLNAWKWIGYTSVVYPSIDPSLKEAAEIDGASVWRRIRHITVPSITSTLVVIMLFQLGSILKGQFDLFYNVIGNNGNFFRTTDIIDTFVFRMLVANFDIGMGTAAALFQSVFGLALILAANLLVRKYRNDYALF
jgi:putative aldouronate transport system permease protein